MLDTIETLHKQGKWLEITTLLVPGFNDHPEELRALTGFIAKLDPLIPWHLTAWHTDYKMAIRGQPQHTPLKRLKMAVAIGREAGLRYTYTGNLGMTSQGSDTDCHHCGKRLLTRSGFTLRQRLLSQDGICPNCQTGIPGRW